MLFSRVLVPLLLDGSKTETRRSSTLARPGDLLWVRETWAMQGHGYVYAADSATAAPRWRPSIHMPMQACRCWLVVRSVYVQELQQLDERGARASGFESVEHFRAYWRAKNGPSRYVVIGFERCPAPRRMAQLSFCWQETSSTP